ncbi:unnamed protein product, partial [Ectocarpus sp. 4 AP-2014]
MYRYTARQAQKQEHQSRHSTTGGGTSSSSATYLPPHTLPQHGERYRRCEWNERTNERTCLHHVPQRIGHVGKGIADMRSRFVHVRGCFVDAAAQEHRAQAPQELAAAPYPRFRFGRNGGVSHGLCWPGTRGRRRSWGFDVAVDRVRCRRCRCRCGGGGGGRG